MTAKHMWMVRAGEGSQYLSEFLELSIAAIGWGKVDGLKEGMSKEAIAKRIRETWPDNNKFKVANAAGQIHRFLNEISPGDWIVTYDSSRRVYHIGEVASGPRSVTDGIEGLRHQRGVDWRAEVPRDELSVPTKNTLGAIQTLFLLSDSARDELLRLTKGKPAEPAQDAEEDEEQLLDSIRSQSKEFIKDRISRLDPYELQDLVAGLLRAMNYKTRVASPGPDRGIDILASPDGFGLEQPRIVVEVKHRKGTMGAQEIRTFLGGRHKDDKGLYVSTGGFTKDARYEADRGSIPVMLMDMDQLVEAVLEHYEAMDTETKVLLPLVKIYWPAA